MTAFSDSPQVYRTVADALRTVRNTFCVGRNYADHAKELGNAVPTEPLIFAKPTHALVAAQGTLHLPQGRSNIHHELEWVFWMKQSPAGDRSLADCVGGVALGLDLTDRDAQNRLKAAGQPWEFAKGFVGSGVLSDFYEVSDWGAFAETEFSLSINDQVVQSGRARDMIFSPDVLVSYVHQHFGLTTDDLLFTGTPEGVGPLKSGDKLELFVENQVWATCVIG